MRGPTWRVFPHLDRPGEVVRQFTPNWFAATMGTGILALILPEVPWVGEWLRPVGEALWLVNIGLFVLFTGLYGAHWLLHGEQARRAFGDRTVSMFVGTIPMGLSTIVAGLVTFGLPGWGEAALDLALMLWWVDAAMALACGVGIPYLMFTHHEHSLDGMTAVWLLPVVAAEVAAASGGVLVPHLADPSTQLAVLVASYALWAYSVPVAFSILAILILRMALHRLPPASMAASSWLALGPIGTGGLCLLLLGREAPSILSAHGLAVAGEAAAGLGIFGALVLWGFGLWWLLLAIMITGRYFRDHVPFNLGWWAYTFPLGVYTLATLELAEAFDVAFFRIAGTIFAVAMAVMWAVVAGRTTAGAVRGNLFVTPGLIVPVAGGQQR